MKQKPTTIRRDSFVPSHPFALSALASVGFASRRRLTLWQTSFCLIINFYMLLDAWLAAAHTISTQDLIVILLFFQFPAPFFCFVLQQPDSSIIAEQQQLKKNAVCPCVHDTSLIYRPHFSFLTIARLAASAYDQEFLMPRENRIFACQVVVILVDPTAVTAAAAATSLHIGFRMFDLLNSVFFLFLTVLCFVG